MLSSYSDPISVSTYEPTSVAQIIYPVLRAVGVSENDPKITIPFCLSAVNDARKYTQGKLYGIRHAWNQEFEYPIKCLAGTNYVDLPDNIDVGNYASIKLCWGNTVGITPSVEVEFYFENF
jgi:hypothetical protein